MNKLQIEYKKVKDLKLNPNNPRKNDDAVDDVVKSIERFGFKNPIMVDNDNVVWCGNTRLKASKKLGLEEVPTINISDLTPDEIRAYAIVDNKSGEIADWDLEMLQEELKTLDLGEFDFAWEDIQEEKEIVEDEVPEVDEEHEPTAKLGDIYQLGNHRLMCGDSTKVDDVEKLMNGNKADMVFTDPPYGMKKEKDGVLNDNLNYDDLLEFNKKWIPLTFEALKDNGSWYCWGIDEPLMDIYSNTLKPMIKDNKITFRNLITWFKNPSGCGDGQNNPLARSYGIITEKCIFVMCGVQGFNTNSDNYFEGWEPIRLYLVNEWAKISEKNDWDKYLGNAMGKHYFTKSQWSLPTEKQYEKLQQLGSQHGAFKREYEEIKREYEEIKREYYSTRAYFDNTHDLMTEVWQFDRTDNEERELAGGHATPKPIPLCSRAIKSSSRNDEIVLDVFGGSGSTLIACEQLNRKCYMMELDPEYVDVIIKRWETLTGKKAELIKGE